MSNRTKRIGLTILALVLGAACMGPGGVRPEPKEPTDRVMTLKVNTLPESELIEPIITANYGPDQELLPADDGRPLNGYIPDPPIVTPWGYEFRLQATTIGPLKASVRIKARRTVKVVCDWYIGAGSTVVVHQDTGYGETVCQSPPMP